MCAAYYHWNLSSASLSTELSWYRGPTLLQLLAGLPVVPPPPSLAATTPSRPPLDPDCLRSAAVQFGVIPTFDRWHAWRQSVPRSLSLATTGDGSVDLRALPLRVVLCGNASFEDRRRWRRAQLTPAPASTQKRPPYRIGVVSVLSGVLSMGAIICVCPHPLIAGGVQTPKEARGAKIKAAAAQHAATASEREEQRRSNKIERRKQRKQASASGLASPPPPSPHPSPSKLNQVRSGPPTVGTVHSRVPLATDFSAFSFVRCIHARVLCTCLLSTTQWLACAHC